MSGGQKKTEDREEVKLMLEQPANPTNHDQPTRSGDLVEGQGMEKDPLTLGLHTCHSHRRWPFHCPDARTWHGPRRRGSERLDDYSSRVHVGVSKNRGNPKWMVNIRENPY